LGKAEVGFGIHLLMTEASSGGPNFRVNSWPGILLAPILIPIILIIKLAERLLGLNPSVDLTAQEVATYLHDCLEGTGGYWDWDDFTSIPITDPTLDGIRDEAASVAWPLDREGEATLRGLLEEVRAL
jgi:hypothetical protein